MKTLACVLLGLFVSFAACAALPPDRAGLFFVAPDGSDANEGTGAHPLATLERARDALRALRDKSGHPTGGAMVIVRGGRYAVTHTLALGAADSGASNAPVVFRAAPGETPVFSGGVRLHGFQPVADADLLARLPEEARGKVVQCDLRAGGLTNFPPLVLGGFGSGRGFRTHPLMELFVDGRPQPRARWPNAGFAAVANVDTNGTFVRKGKAGSRDGVIGYDGDRPARWREEKDLWLYGYWFWDWADSYEKVSDIDPEARAIALEPPLHTYGFRKGQPYLAYNAFSEIDRPGEWYLDRERGALFLWPPADLKKAVVELSVLADPMVKLDQASHVRFEGLTWELGGGDGLLVLGGEDCGFCGCIVRRGGGTGIRIDGGRRHTVRSCDVHDMGRGGISVAGGERGTLAAAGHVVENCHLHDLSRVDHTYTPGVRAHGVGLRIAHNLVHDLGSSAFNVGGNEITLEYNEVTRVVLESDDQGGVDTWGDPTFRGNVYRWNFFHHLGSAWGAARAEPKLGQAGIRLDDAISGHRIVENVFWHASGGRHGFGAVQIHGGKENVVESNLFVDCASAVSFSSWRNADRWREWVAKYTNRVDMTLYTNRYPALSRLYEDLDVNEVRGNLVAHCGEFLHRGSALTNGNVIVTNSVPPAELLRLPGAPSIPLEKIGLYRDEWRKQIAPPTPAPPKP
jgi:hypothetical protein